MKITTIPPAVPSLRPMRVAVYCRISTLLDGQLTSIENQREHYMALVSGHAGWNLAGIYLEEGISGTKKSTRPALMRLLSDCKTEQIDIILTKSISRFARNVTDCLEMVRVLTNLNVRIIFEKEHLDTGQMGSEFLLTILSSFAEAESRSISDNEKWAIQKQFQEGTYPFRKAPYGYALKNGTFVPNPAEASVVKWIFQRVLEGQGSSRIADELNRMHLPSPENRTWCDRTIRGIVRNPACVGDVLMNKSYRDRHFRRHLNLGERPLYYQDHHHRAIINHDTFDRANASLTQRGREKGNVPDSSENAKHLNPHTRRYPFSGKLFCGTCGSSFRRVTQYTVSGTTIRWECTGHRRDKMSCSLKRVPEAAVQAAFLTCLCKMRYAPFLLDEYCSSSLSDQSFKAKKLRSFLARFSSAAAFPDEEFCVLVDKVIVRSQSAFTFIFSCGLAFFEEVR